MASGRNGTDRKLNRRGLAESRMHGNTHVRFGGAGRGNGSAERLNPRPGPTPTRRSTTPDAGSAATSTATTTGRTRGSTTGHPTRCAGPGRINSNYTNTRPNLSTAAGSTSQPFPGGPSHVYRFISGLVGGSVCGLGWKSLGVLELTALPSIKEEYWVPAVQEVDALLVWGGSPLYLCYWMRQSGLADLLPSLRRETVYVGTS